MNFLHLSIALMGILVATGNILPATGTPATSTFIAQKSDRDLLEQGQAQFRNHDYQGAIEKFSQAIANDPNNSRAYFLRGLARTLLKDDQGAIEDFTEIIRLEPNNANAYFLRGVARTSLTQHQGALEDLTVTIRLDPNNANAYLVRGLIRASAGEQEVAITDVQTAANLYRQQGDTARYQKTVQILREEFKVNVAE
ncbi:MAG: tetratricopeptide repeat protein [Actinomycetota bacterium]